MCLRLLGMWSVIVLSLTGCSLTVRVPPPAENSLTCYLVDHGYHGSLVLPGARGEFHEYVYGEYQWFALENDSWYRVFPALFWPTESTMGTRLIKALSTRELIRQLNAVEVYPFKAQRDRVENLHARLQREMETGDQERMIMSGDMVFVPHTSKYYLGHTCNTLLTVWLEELGCEVSGLTPWASFDVVGR